MIKKNTIAIFREENNEKTEKLTGGIPLSVGETMIIKNNEEFVNWKVIDKRVEYSKNGEDQIVNVTYVFEKV